MKHYHFTLTILFFAVIIFGCKEKSHDANGTVKTLIGSATLDNGSRHIELKAGDIISAGDTIRTGPDTVVIASFSDGLADIEIQSNTVFIMKEFLEKNKELKLDKGNAWLRINRKLNKDETLSLLTDTTVAAVRGTKFYTFQMADLQGTCVCQGNIDYSVTGGEKSEIYKKDFLIFSRNRRTITLLPEELTFMGPEFGDHRHSMLHDSPLGPEAIQMTDKQKTMLINLIEKKFKDKP